MVDRNELRAARAERIAAWDAERADRMAARARADSLVAAWVSADRATLAAERAERRADYVAADRAAAWAAERMASAI